MDATAGNDGFVRISFTFAAQGSDVVPPRAGECAWHDRGFRSGEPTMLVYAANGKDANSLLQAAGSGGAFKVHAYNNNQGALVVTSVDAVSVASVPPPHSPSGGPTTFPRPQGGTPGIAIVTRDLNVRTGPGNGNKVIGILPAGTPVPIAGCDGSWCQLGLQPGLQIGWVSKQYLQF